MEITLNAEAITLLILSTLVTTTKPNQEKFIKEAAAAVAGAVASSETKIDDSVVRELLVPNLKLLISEIEAQLA